MCKLEHEPESPFATATAELPDCRYVANIEPEYGFLCIFEISKKSCILKCQRMLNIKLSERALIACAAIRR